MRSLLLRRTLTWAVITFFLVTLAVALVIVWTANERQWYLEATGVSATLDMSLSDTARWVATAILGALILLSLAALLVEFASARHLAPHDREEDGMPAPVTGKTFTYTPQRHEERGRAAAAGAAPAADTGRYQSTIVGDEVTQRMEQSLPARPPQPDTSEPLPANPRTSEPPTSRRAAPTLKMRTYEHRDARAHDTMPLQSFNRR